LDADHDGKLTRTEWQHAPQTLRKYDLNEDEYLDLAELLASPMPGSRISPAQVKLSENGKMRDAVLRLDVGAKTGTPTITGKNAELVRPVAISAPDSPSSLRPRPQLVDRISTPANDA
jgi:hypothetical protein